MALSDTQLMLLSAAFQRQDLLVTLPAHPRTGAARVSLSKLLSQGLLEEVTVGREQPHWRIDDGGQLLGLRITRAGLEAIGLEPDGEPARSEGASGTLVPIPSREAAAPVQGPPAPRDGSKQALVIALLRRGEGASLDQLAAATGWLPHTTRAALTSLRKKGHALTREKRHDGTSIYRIGGPEA
jgi:hypothetical protein